MNTSHHKGWHHAYGSSIVFVSLVHHGSLPCENRAAFPLGKPERVTQPNLQREVFNVGGTQNF